jgi:hypothetical protein
MNSNAMIVTGVVSSFSFPMSCKFYYELASKNSELFRKIYCKYGNDYLTPCSDDDIYKLLNECSLVELREFLYLLVPLVSQSKISPIIKLKIVIHVIEKELYFMIDENKNNFDLVNVNKQLKNECDNLKGELEAINKIINKNNFDLVNVNQQLKNECDNLKSELEAINKIINKK